MIDWTYLVRVVPKPLLRVVCSWRGGLSLACLLLVAFAALLAPWVAPYAYDIQHLAATNQDPSLAHWLGTDEFGRDVLSRIIFGARTSLVVALTAIGISLTLGICLGAAAGYFGGAFDRAVTAVVDLTWSFPEVLIALIFVAIIGPGLGSTMVAISIAYLAQFSRLTRAQIMGLKNETYVEAAHNFGAGHLHILFRHLLPNALTPVIVAGMLATGDAIILEATLGFFGLGVQPPKPSWGAMMSSGTAQIFLAPWTILGPGLAIAIVVVSINLFGDALIEALDIRNRLRDH
ncbi:ABC transporter permease [Rhodoferax sp.]|uniref:ABC transporter permease n=1 Tax=Rhodoferax sp. TaxID=50421 RepID=UPI00374D2637